jgi:uncharacterized protein (DUF927 family)
VAVSEKWSKIGEAMWEEAGPIAATIAEVYCKENRAVYLPFSPDVVRFHPAAAHPKLKTKMPALVVKVNGSAEPAYNFTWLAPDGKAKAPLDKKEQRRTLGSNKGGAVHLAEPEPGKPLLLGEGVETVATAIEATGLPGWATLGTAALSNIELPEGVTEVIHLAENDEANQKALNRVCPLLAERGVTNRIARPPTGFKDFNDMVKGNGVDRSSGLTIAKMAIEAAGPWSPKKAKAKEPPDPSEGKFLLDENGLFKREHGKWNKVAQSFEILGLARDAVAETDKDAGWGTLIRFRNRDQRLFEEIINHAALYRDPDAVLSQLTDRGMQIEFLPPARRALAQYLFSVDADQRVTVAHTTGWVGRAFILPTEIIGASDERVILAQHVKASYVQRGTLDDWRATVAAPAADHRMLRFALSIAFVAPLLMPGGFESGLVHLHGPSSVGKTTLLRAAASVWGSGADGGYMRAWRTTANALEATLASACDTLLVLDELGQADSREIGPVVYMIAGAVGKSRMRRDSSLRAAYIWRVMALSSGETPIAYRLSEDQKVKRAHAGQLARAIDVPARRELGVFDQPYPDFDPKTFADEMKRAASACYGTAGSAFVRGLIERRIAGENVRRLVADFVDDALGSINTDHGQAARAAERFGLIAAAGRLAAEFGLVSWRSDLPGEDALELFKAWLATRGGAQPAEIKQMIEQVRRFIEAHGDARFDLIEPPDPDRKPVNNRAGWRRGEGDERRWLVPPQIWRDEICAGFDPREVAKALIDLGMMEPGDGVHQSQKLRLPKSQTTQRLYVITPAIFEGWEK